jgi:uncharacterized membrane protein YdcZ (DUF606 family)
MVQFVINMILIIVGFLMIKFRERIADMLGEAQWMRYVGGVYGFVVVIGVLMVFYGVARLTGTTDILMAPIFGIIPDQGPGPSPTF